MSEITFNINNYVKVKLTDAGFEHWMKSANRFFEEMVSKGRSNFEKHIHPIEWFKGKADIDGYVLFQGWSFVDIFGGGFSSPGSTQLYDANILICLPD